MQIVFNITRQFNTDNHFNISPAECREELEILISFRTTWRLFEVPLTIGT